MKLMLLNRNGIINKNSLDYIKVPEEWVVIKGRSPCGGCQSLYEKHK